MMMLYCHLPYHNDSIIKTHAERRRKDFFRKIFTSQFIARVRKGCLRVACERMLETEHKLHILTPLLWPSRCVFIVLLMLGSTPSGLFRGPPRSGVAFPTTSGLYCLEVCWQLLRGFPRSPSVWCGLPYHISSLTLWASAGNCFGGFPSASSVGCGLPYHIWSLLSGIRLATALGPKLNWVK